MHEITINRGSDVTLTGTWRGQNGQPLNLEGWSIDAFEPHPSLAEMVVEWVNAALGQYRVRIDWSSDIPHGKLANFRLIVSKDGDDRTSPRITLVVK